MFNAIVREYMKLICVALSLLLTCLPHVSNASVCYDFFLLTLGSESTPTQSSTATDPRVDIGRGIALTIQRAQGLAVLRDAKSRLEKRQWSEAEHFFESYFRFSPEIKTARSILQLYLSRFSELQPHQGGQKYRERKELDRASQSWLEKLRELQPNHPEMSLYEDLTHLTRIGIPRAQQEVISTESGDSDSFMPAVLSHTEVESPDQLYRNFDITTPELDQLVSLRMRLLVASGLLWQAIQHGEYVAEKSPHNAENHSKLAQLSLVLRRFPQAEQHFRDAIRESKEAHYVDEEGLLYAIFSQSKLNQLRSEVQNLSDDVSSLGKFMLRILRQERITLSVLDSAFVDPRYEVLRPYLIARDFNDGRAEKALDKAIDALLQRTLQSPPYYYFYFTVIRKIESQPSPPVYHRLINKTAFYDMHTLILFFNINDELFWNLGIPLDIAPESHRSRSLEDVERYRRARRKATSP